MEFGVAQRIFDAMRNQDVLSFKNSALMMRNTIRSNKSLLAYQMLCMVLELIAFDALREGLDERARKRHFKRDVVTGQQCGLEVGD